MKSYIGITDFTDYSQVQEMLRVFNENRSKKCQHVLHVGVMMSYKTLHEMNSKWINVFPQKERISSIFSSSEVFNCLHFADYNNSPRLSESLSKALMYTGRRINALQLDMTWPDPNEIKNVFPVREDIEIILQIGKKAFEMVDNDPKKLVQRLEIYECVIHRVLLDKSMGRGVGMDASELLPFVREIKNHFSNLGIVAGGGLGPETIDLVNPLVDEFPDISIDAQGQLRSSGSALDPIEWHRASEYIKKALQIFQ